MVKMPSSISRTIWLLGWISLFTDMASEMLYPVMPLYLQQAGYTIVMIGVLESVAEACAGFAKIYFGRLSDITGSRVAFVKWGYGISAISKPMIALSVLPAWIFLVRCVDRLGKGLRTGARDAILHAESTTANRARVFGFHRSMDTIGAFIGPALALLWLYFFPGTYLWLFLIAFLPGAAAVVCCRWLKSTASHPPSRLRPRIATLLSYWRQSGDAYKKRLLILLAFTLINSSDALLLLQLKSKGLSDSLVIGLYIFYNAVFALAAYPFGKLADKWGLKKMFMMGWLFFAFVYAGMGCSVSVWTYGLLFLMYGAYAAATEGVAKAWLSNTCPPQHAGAALGTYAGLQSLAALFSSSVAGLVWWKMGATTLFWGTAVLVLLLALALLFFHFKEHEPEN
jgi:MFS family permease